MPRDPSPKRGHQEMFAGGQASISASADKFRPEFLLNKKGGDVGSRTQRVALNVGQLESPILPSCKIPYITKPHANHSLA